MSLRLEAALGVIGLTIGLSDVALAGNTVKRIVVEADAVAPATAFYENMNHGAKTNKIGALVDFNFGEFSMGPEIWTGTFVMKGPGDDATYRRQDMWPGEQDKIEAIRLRWNIGFWEVPETMRGWYVKLGYSFTNITGHINRYPMTVGSGQSRPTQVPGVDPMDVTQVITDRRNGMDLALGQRWMYFDQRLSLTVGISFTFNFSRIVDVDGKDPNARDNYNETIRNLPLTAMGTKPFPEANLALGYVW